MKGLRSQISFEFFTLIALAFLAVIFLIAASAGQVKEFRDQKEFLLLKDLTLKLQREVNLASSVEDGYIREFNLPDKLDGIDYFMINTNSTITANTSKAVFSTGVPIIYGKNFTKGANRIEKINGKVYVNK